MARAQATTSRTRRIAAATTVLVALAVVSAGPAVAAPPGNDARSAAEPIGPLPTTVRGSTAEATLEADEPWSGCGRALKGSVWYSFTAATTRSVLLAFDAGGDMDAEVAVFLRQRSQLTAVVCGVSDSRGEATLDVEVAEGASYLVRIAPLFNSVADSFALQVVEPDRPAQAPGRPLAASGVAATVDRFANPDDAWSTRLRQGRTYRLNFVTKGDGCAAVAVYRPGVKNFDGPTLVERSCDAHVVFAAPESGVFSIYVRAPRASRLKLPYRLRVGLALADDTAPGIRLPNALAVKGSLAGSELDALDLYRFSVLRHSDLALRLRTARNFELTLLSAGGRRLGRGAFIERRMTRGRYFVAVRALDGADGSYVLKRVTRTITSARTLVDGQRSRTVGEGRSVVLSVAVQPSVGGFASMLVERFDPIDGWLFHARYRPAVVGGRAAVTFLPSSVGRWRVTGRYEGTPVASPSEGGTATLLVTEPLTG